MDLELLQARKGAMQDAERRVAAAQAAAREARVMLERSLAEHHGLEDVRVLSMSYGTRWNCEDPKNPIGVCYYPLDDENCIVCGQPEERL